MRRLSTRSVINFLGGTFAVARKTRSKPTTVSDWKHMKKIPDGKMVLLVRELEDLTNGKYGRKAFFPDTWKQIWPEMEKK